MNKDKKIFLVFNTSYLGDGLVCNTLCQNIKRIYPESKIVFIINKPFYDIAKYQADVDDVVILDKKGEHRGIKGILKFIKTFPYKNAYASFLTYKNLRNYWISIFTGCFRVFQGEKHDNQTSIQLQILNLLSRLTKTKLDNCPIKYYPPELPKEVQKLLPNSDYIAISAITKKESKNIPLETVVEIIKKLNNQGYNVVLTGVGELNQTYAQELTRAGCEFTNLIDKTTICELAGVLKSAKGLISADTGSMHLGYAVGTPTVAVFYEQNTLKNWAPNEEMYNVKLVRDNQDVKNIISALGSLINSEGINV